MFIFIDYKMRRFFSFLGQLKTMTMYNGNSFNFLPKIKKWSKETSKRDMKNLVNNLFPSFKNLKLA